MADIAASVLARLKNKAAESGKSYQLCLQLFCQEEFLRRLEKSEYADNFVLKGGLFIYSLSGFDSRVTVDVDFLLRKIPNTAEQLKTIIEKIIRIPTENEFITFEIKNINPIALTKKYAGIGVSLIAKIKNTRTPFGIDIGIGDVIVPKEQKLIIPTQLPDFRAPTINSYSIETTVAEKIDAILDLMEFSSRMKDYYDIYYLASNFDFEGKILTEALHRTFTNRGHLFRAGQLKEICNSGEDAGMNRKWNAFLRKSSIKSLNYSAVLSKISDFLSESFSAAIKSADFNKHWSASDGLWNVGEMNEVINERN